jgi:hypothetical protein
MNSRAGPQGSEKCPGIFSIFQALRCKKAAPEASFCEVSQVSLARVGRRGD